MRSRKMDIAAVSSCIPQSVTSRRAFGSIPPIGYTRYSSNTSEKIRNAAVIALFKRVEELALTLCEIGIKESNSKREG